MVLDPYIYSRKLHIENNILQQLINVIVANYFV